MKIQDRDFFFEELQRIYPDPIIELNYTTPFQLLIAVILSAQSTDKQVNKVTNSLFQSIKSPQDIVNMWLTQLSKNIQSIWLYNWKSKNIYATSKIMISEEFNQKHSQEERFRQTFTEQSYYIPDTLAWLMDLPWVWEKTAKVVLRALYELPFVAVDTHVHRVANRIGLVNTKSPLETSKIVEKKISKKYIHHAHHSIILFGRYHCTARKPQCHNCPFTKFCLYFKSL